MSLGFLCQSKSKGDYSGKIFQPTIMTEELVSFPVAKLARKKGFDEQCRHGFEWYIFNKKEYGPTPLEMPEVPAVSNCPPEERHSPFNEGLMKTLGTRKMNWPFFRNSHLPSYLYARPTQDLLERWLREIHKLAVSVYIYEDLSWQWIIQKIGTRKEHSVLPEHITGKPNSMITFELAKEAALLHALKLLPKD